MIRLLGPVDFTQDGVAVPIGSRSERTLLGALAISANHAVSSEQLAQILWDEDPPPSRDNTLQTHVARLRHLLGHDRISGEGHAYELNVANDELDALVFEDLVATAAGRQGTPEESLELCKKALSLWRGTPFGDLVGDDPFRLEAIRLDELRIYAMELQLECEIVLGRDEIVVGSLEALVEEYPYRERIWFLLASALARCGRRVEALRACNRLREILTQTGLEPSAEMRRLEEEIVSEAPRVEAKLGLVLTDLDHDS